MRLMMIYLADGPLICAEEEAAAITRTTASDPRYYFDQIVAI